VLFVGTEFGLYVTVDGGRHWAHASGTLPRVRVDDIIVHPTRRDLVLGTHGRSIIVLDDLGLFDRGAPVAAAGDAVLYPIRPAMQRFITRVLPTPGARTFQAPNPPPGAIITYALGAPASPSDTVARLSVADASGKVVRTQSVAASAGLHRTGWDLHYDRAPGVTDADEGWFGLPTGAWVLPGRYTVTLTARGKSVSQAVEVTGDSRLDVASGALEARHTASQELAALQRSFNDGVVLHRRMASEYARLDTALAGNQARRDSLATLSRAVKVRLDSLGRRFGSGFSGPKFGFLDLDGSMQASSTGPTVAQQRALGQLRVKLREDLTALNALMNGDFAELQRRAVGVTSALAPVTLP